MEYIEITLKVPKGFEKQIEDLVMLKIEGILSQMILKPSIEKKAEFQQEVEEIYRQNGRIYK